MSRKYFIMIGLLLLVITIISLSRMDKPKTPIEIIGINDTSSMTTSVFSDDPLENAILNDNWQKVFDILQKVNEKTEDPIARFIMAHVCLVTNQNNASLLLFLSVQEKGDIELWLNWTESFVNRYADNPIALYLLGDAEARIGKVEEAKGKFDQALQINRNFALALNARGVVNVMCNLWNEALMDFYQATKLAPTLADAYANLGTYWVLRKAPEGAIEAFNNALTINPDFALAYNGRGCAHFGKGDFDKAIDDTEKASELSPVLLPASANQGIVLAALSSPSIAKTSDSNLGMNLIARSELEKVDYTSFTSAKQMTNFYQSLAEIGRNDAVAASRAALIQTAKVQNRIDNLDNAIDKLRPAITSSDESMKELRFVDEAMELTKVANGVLSTTLSTRDGWNHFLKMGSKTAGAIADVSTEKSASKVWAETISRALDPNPMRAILRVGAHSSKEIAGTYGHIARNRISSYTMERTLRTRQYHDLWQEAGKYMVQATIRGEDLSRLDVLGRHSIPMKPTRSPIPEHSINYNSPLTQFKALSGEIATGITSSPKSAHTTFAEKSPLVVISGIDRNMDARSILGTGAMVRELENKGIQVLPVPTGSDPRLFAAGIGADRIVNLNYQTSPSLSKRHDISISSPKSQVGGVTQDMSHAHVDKGNWPVMTFFGLFYR